MTYDCSASGYYEKVQIKEQHFPYVYDEMDNTFFISIPELCLTLRTPSLDTLGIDKETYLAKGDSVFLEKDMQQIQREKEKGIIIHTNVISLGDPRNTGYTEVYSMYNKPRDTALEVWIKDTYALSNSLCTVNNPISSDEKRLTVANLSGELLC
jgi:hypothetical protein